MTVSVIVVNGPGEARETDIGLTGGGNGTHQVYLSGLTDHRFKDADIVDHLVEPVEKKAAEMEAAKRAMVEDAMEPAEYATALDTELEVALFATTVIMRKHDGLPHCRCLQRLWKADDEPVPVRHMHLG